MKAEEMFRSYTARKQEVDLLKFRITNFRGIKLPQDGGQAGG